MSKCRACKSAAIIDLPRHNAAFCSSCLEGFVVRQVEKAIKKYSMFERSDRVCVAVSGGKDSLALWNILHSLGYETKGVYVGLGIGEYSDQSLTYVRAFASQRGLPLEVIDLTTTYCFNMDQIGLTERRSPCGTCGLSKRYILNQVATKGDTRVIATGHNLDDEGAVLLGNVMRWNMDYLSRQYPTLDGKDGLAKKVKPLVRLTEREMAAYCVVMGIEYQVEECPMAVGNQHIKYKQTLNAMEAESPGSKAAFVMGFFDKCHQALQQGPSIDLNACADCGFPTTNQTCSFCQLTRRVSAADK